MDQIGFETGTLSRGTMSVDEYTSHLHRVGGKAAFQLDGAQLRRHLQLVLPTHQRLHLKHLQQQLSKYQQR